MFTRNLWFNLMQNNFTENEFKSAEKYMQIFISVTNGMWVSRLWFQDYFFVFISTFFFAKINVGYRTYRIVFTRVFWGKKKKLENRDSARLILCSNEIENNLWNYKIILPLIEHKFKKYWKRFSKIFLSVEWSMHLGKGDLPVSEMFKQN